MEYQLLYVYAILAVLFLISLANWRLGLFVVILVGFLQDPMRKLDPAESLYFTTLVIIFALIALLTIALSQKRINTKILHYHPNLRLPLRIFIAFVLLQSINAVWTTKNPIIGGIGLIGYFGPILSVVLAAHYTLAAGKFEHFVKFYVLSASIFTLGVYLEYFGYNWNVLGSVGTPLYAYHIPGKATALASGLMRSPEVAAWHGAMLAMLSLVLSTISRSTLKRILWLFLAVLGLLAVVLTGRRKGIAEFIVFVIAASTIVYYLKSSNSKIYIRVTVFMISLSIAVLAITPFIDAFADLHWYFGRFAYNPESPLSRAWNMTVGSFGYVIAHNSIMGTGAGVGSQGAQYFGGIRTGGSAEGGLAKLLAEIGIFGLVIFFWLALRMLQDAFQIIRQTRLNWKYERLAIGLTAVIIANGINFALAHQVYGDPFVLIILGACIGFLYTIPFLLRRDILKKRHTIHPTPQPGSIEMVPQHNR